MDKRRGDSNIRRCMAGGQWCLALEMQDNQQRPKLRARHHTAGSLKAPELGGAGTCATGTEGPKPRAWAPLPSHTPLGGCSSLTQHSLDLNILKTTRFANK